MSAGAFHPTIESLPRELSIFPLSGALLLPRGQLPLHVFEPRYLSLTLDALGQGRMFGMIQPRDAEAPEPPALFDIGCLGRISSFSETEDGRLYITLTGVCRFRVLRELDGMNGYRRVEADYGPFLHDMEEEPEPALDRDRLMAVIEPYFRHQGADIDGKAIEGSSNSTLVSALSMICPFQPNEKQALLEAPSLAERAGMLLALIEMGLLDREDASRQN